MGKLIGKIVTLILVTFVVCNILSMYLVSRYREPSNSIFWSKGSEEGYSLGLEAINKAKNSGSAEVAVIGDSVARYIKEDSGTINLATNFWVSMAGQYVLVNNLIEHSKNIKKVYLFVIPESLRNDLAGFGIYNYFVKPFYTYENLSYFSSDTIHRVRGNPFSIFYLMPMSKILPIFSVSDYSNNVRTIKSEYVSPTSMYYLRKMKELCIAHNVQFVVLPCPISKTRMGEYCSDNVQSKIGADSSKYQLNDIIQDYFKDPVVVEDRYFGPDLRHCKDDVSILYLSNIVYDKYLSDHSRHPKAQSLPISPVTNLLKAYAKYITDDCTRILKVGANIIVDSQGDDPRILLPYFMHSKDVMLKVLINSSCDTFSQFYYKTDGADEYSEINSVKCPIVKGNNLLSIPIKAKNTVGQLRFDPGAKQGKYTLKLFEASDM